MQGSIVLDPFAGSCSLLRAAEAAGASCTLGSDISAAYFPTFEMYRRTRIDCAVADIRKNPLRRCTVDAIVTDPPYGRRASFGAAGGNVRACPAALIAFIY